MPGHGIGYGLLAHQGDEETRALRLAPSSYVSFNYLGQFDQMTAEAILFRPTAEPAGPTRNPRAHRTHLIEVGGMVTGGRLLLSLGYSTNLHRRETIERLGASLAAALRALLAHCQLGKEIAVSPSDFPLANLNEQTFRKLSAMLDIAE